jgi:hypothetical protein
VRIPILLATGLLAITLAVGLTVSHTPLELARTNGVPLTTPLSETQSDTSFCQAGETLPRNTTAIRLGLFSLLGPRLTVKVLAGPRVLTEGARGPGWDGTYIPVAVRRTTRTFSHVVVCVSLSSVDSRVSLLGARTAGAPAVKSRGATLPGRMGIEYLQPGREPWWSSAGSIARRLGFGHAAGGAWDVVIVTALTAAVVALSSSLVLRELR